MTPAIRFHRVGKKFKLSPSRPRSFQQILVDRRLRAPAEEFWALKDVSFEIQPGETVGLIGANGSGKSTILKLISRIIDPSAGEVTSTGRIAGLLELGAGFHPDLTGRENIYLNASILGIPRSVIKRHVDEIVGFAEIGSFIDVPVRNYSSGMAMRLGFAITTMLDPEILLIDEILAVGDHSFQRRCLERLDALRAQGITTIFVSHSLEQVQRLCRRAIWLAGGQVRADGDAEAVVGMYLHAEAASEMGRHSAHVRSGREGVNRWGTYQAEITRVELLDGQGRPRQLFMTGDSFRIRMYYRTRTPIVEPAFGLAIYRNDGLHVNGPNTLMEGFDIPAIDGCGYVDYAIEHLPLVPGRYELTVAIYNQDATVAHDHHHRLYVFEVYNRPTQWEMGVVHIPARWQHVSNSE